MTTRNGFSRTIIPFPEGEYMRRWIFQCRWFTVRLHKIQLADEYRPHNHPWNFISIILRGAYDEAIYSHIDGQLVHTTVLRRAFRPVYRHKDTFHRVIPLRRWGPVWTLVLTGPKRIGVDGDASWGFLGEDGSITHWRYDPLTDYQQAAFGHETPEV